MLEQVDKIDFNELYDLLLDASRKAFRSVQEAHPAETFYTFGFYYSQSWDFIIPTCNSEEAHMRLGNLTDYERDHQILEWFYSRCWFYDWEYCSLGKEYFIPVSEWMRHNFYPLAGVGTHDEVAAWTTVDEAVALNCLKVLKELDKEKLFGQGKARERVVLNVLYRDTIYQDNLDNVCLLNPLSTYERWRFEREMQGHAFSVLSPARFDRKPN